MKFLFEIKRHNYILRFTKRLFLIITIITLLLIIFRAPLYREIISYQTINERFSYIISNDKLKNYIEKNSAQINNPELFDIVKLSLKMTSNELQFSKVQKYDDPNKLYFEKDAHCIGYAAFCSSICNYLFIKKKFDENWRAVSVKGHIFIFGKNIHNYLKSAFFKDHDFVVIKNMKTNERFAVDPSLHDYLLIDHVTLKE